MAVGVPGGSVTVMFCGAVARGVGVAATVGVGVIVGVGELTQPAANDVKITIKASKIGFFMAYPPIYLVSDCGLIKYCINRYRIKYQRL
jgi:hypothetical protein